MESLQETDGVDKSLFPGKVHHKDDKEMNFMPLSDHLLLWDKP